MIIFLHDWNMSKVIEFIQAVGSKSWTFQRVRTEKETTNSCKGILKVWETGIKLDSDEIRHAAKNKLFCAALEYQESWINSEAEFPIPLLGYRPIERVHRWINGAFSSKTLDFFEQLLDTHYVRVLVWDKVGRQYAQFTVFTIWKTSTFF